MTRIDRTWRTFVCLHVHRGAPIPVAMPSDRDRPVEAAQARPSARAFLGSFLTEPTFAPCSKARA